jgi:xanthine dehydrogenase large subunit
MGGAFGGKESQAAALAAVAGLAAMITGRAVKYRMRRREDMTRTGKRHDFECKTALGIDDNGVIQAAVIELSARCGYSTDLSEGIVDRAMFHADNAYSLGSVSIRGEILATNTVSNTAFRGFGGPQGM